MGVLARDPDTRPASADVLQRQLEGFAAGQRIQLGTARVAAYLADAFPPGRERAMSSDASAPFALPSTRTSAPPPLSRGSSSAPREHSTDLDGLPPAPSPSPRPKHWTGEGSLALASQEALRELEAEVAARARQSSRPAQGLQDSDSEAEDTLVGQSQAPAATERRPSLSPERPSVGVYIHVGGSPDDVNKKG